MSTAEAVAALLPKSQTVLDEALDILYDNPQKQDLIAKYHMTSVLADEPNPSQ